MARDGAGELHISSSSSISDLDSFFTVKLRILKLLTDTVKLLTLKLLTDTVKLLTVQTRQKREHGIAFMSRKKDTLAIGVVETEVYLASSGERGPFFVFGVCVTEVREGEDGCEELLRVGDDIGHVKEVREDRDGCEELVGVSESEQRPGCLEFELEQRQGCVVVLEARSIWTVSVFGCVGGFSIIDIVESGIFAFSFISACCGWSGVDRRGWIVIVGRCGGYGRRDLTWCFGSKAGLGGRSVCGFWGDFPRVIA